MQLINQKEKEEEEEEETYMEYERQPINIKGNPNPMPMHQHGGHNDRFSSIISSRRRPDISFIIIMYEQDI